MRVIRSLLWIDCGAGLLVGAFMLSLSAWLSPLYGLPLSMIVVMGVANIGYGAFSFSLARRAVRPRAMLVLLVTANAIWAVLCAVAAVVVAPKATVLGIATLSFESLFVGGLAVMEWRHLESLRVAS